MDNNALFWKIQAGLLPAPEAVQTLGGELISVDPEHGVVETLFEGRREFTNPIGYIQGGFLAAMLDDTMGPALACILRAGEFAPTLSLTVQFLRPAMPGALQGLGRVVRRGERVCHLAGELLQGSALVATASAVALICAS